MENTITAIMCKPSKAAYQTTIANTLEAMQKAVGGDIEVLHLGDGAVLVCNEDGKLTGLAQNRAISTVRGRVTDVICGTFFICATDGEEFVSLDASQLARWLGNCNGLCVMRR